MIMKSAIFMDGKKFVETEFKLEINFEKIVREHFKTLFGAKTIFFLIIESPPLLLENTL